MNYLNRRYLNAWFECNDIVISVYSQKSFDQNAKIFDTKGPFTNYICIFWHFLTTYLPSLHFLFSKFSIFLTTYPLLNANVICEGSLKEKAIGGSHDSLRKVFVYNPGRLFPVLFFDPWQFLQSMLSALIACSSTFQPMRGWFTTNYAQYTCSYTSNLPTENHHLADR